MRKIEVTLTEGNTTLLRLELPTNLDAAQVLDGVNRLAKSSLPLESPPSAPNGSKKYRALTDHLSSAPTPLALSFSEIEHLLDTPLPSSAREHRAWWSNSGSHSQARAWKAAGWEMESVDMAKETVIFRKEK